MTSNIRPLSLPDEGPRRAEDILGYPVKSFRWTVERATILPGAARELIENQPRQRPIRHGHVKDLAGQLMSGRWNGDTPEPVCFDEFGLLLEGQHRLLACVQAGVALTVDVKFNVPRSAFAVINRGRGRNLGDDLVTNGRTAEMWVANTAAAAARILRSWDEGYSPTAAADVLLGRTAHADVLAVLDRHPLLLPTCEWAHARTQRATIRLPGSVFAAMLTLMREADDTLALLFGEQVLTGENIQAGDPAFELRKAQHGAKSRARDERAALMFRMVRAWNALREGRRIFKLYGVSVGGSFPEIAGLQRPNVRKRGGARVPGEAA